MWVHLFLIYSCLCTQFLHHRPDITAIQWISVSCNKGRFPLLIWRSLQYCNNAFFSFFGKIISLIFPLLCTQAEPCFNASTVTYWCSLTRIPVAQIVCISMNNCWLPAATAVFSKHCIPALLNCIYLWKFFLNLL